MHRRDAGLPEDTTPPAGIYLTRNPGVALVWVTREWQIERVRARQGVRKGILFRFGDPIETHWFCEGRPATRADTPPNFESPQSYRAVTKWSARVNAAPRVPALLRRAFTLLRSGRPAPVLVHLLLEPEQVRLFE